ncbi:MAG: serine/threonine-protein kinase, partial [Planctomycetota bacterium]
MNDVDKTLSSISLLSLERLDVACNAFESELNNQQQPRIEDYLKSESEQDNRLLLRELLNLEINHRRSQGMEATQAEYETRFSGHPQIVREAFSRSQNEEESSRDYSGQLVANRYQVGSLLGSGAFSDVYLAEDTERKLPVALKILKSTSGLDVDRLLDEANLLSSLNHRNIVGAYHSGKAGDTAFIAMQYINGSTLAEMISTDGAMKPGKVVDLISKVCDALHFAHQEGLTHRDIKPENIIVDSNGQPYVADFGFALHESEQDFHYGDRSGTPYYRSPEQVRGEADWIDGRADLWAVGVMLYEMMTGRRPFQGDSIEEIDRQIQGRSPKPPRQIDSSIPDWLEAVTLKCLSSSPENRYATASELADALRTKRHPQRSMRMVRRVVAVAAGLLLLA